MILDELELLQPDLIGLQEVIDPGGGMDNRAKVLADSLFYRTGFSYEHIYEYTHFSWGTWDEGIGILSRHIILDSDVAELPPGVFQRKALWCRILTSSGIVNFVDTHLSFGNQQQQRILQVEAIKAFISQKSADSVAFANILCGDFNSIPNSPPILLLTVPDTNGTVYIDSWEETNPGQPGYTVPSDNPSERIDYIFIKDGESGGVIGSEVVFEEPNANGIYPSDHLGVFSTLKTTIHKLNMNILSPLAGDEVFGETMISWSFGSQPEPLTIMLYLSNDAGRTWREEWTGPNANNSYVWNTLLAPDGARYMLRIAAVGDTSFGMTQSAGTFTVNNPGNASPEIELLSPRGGELISGDYLVKWNAVDADGDSLIISLDISSDGGSSWQELTANEPNDGLYTWETQGFANSPLYRMRLRCSDGLVEVADTSGMFTVQNEHPMLPDSIFHHVTGHGNGTINGNIVDPTQLTDHLYKITFDDTLYEETTYDVFDVDRDSFVVQGATQLNGVTEGPVFDGLRLIILNYSKAVVDQEHSGWLIGNTNLTHTISIAVVNIGGQTLEGIPYPSDYKLTIFDQVVDTSSTFLGAPPLPMKFTVENLTENHPVEIIYVDPDNNQTISRNDLVYILEEDANEDLMLTWLISFSGPANPILPAPGDEFLLATLKPFTHNDIFEFTLASVALDDKDAGNIPLKFQLFQNYPNPFNPATTIRYQLPRSTKVILNIYNILGQRVKTLVDEVQTAGAKSVHWEGKNNAGQNVSSGIYIYRLQAGGKTFSRKMLLLK